MKNIKYFFTFLLVNSLFSYSQVGIGSNTPNASAAFELNSSSKGFLPPRMTNEQMLAIPNPATGLLLFCTDCGPLGFYQYNGTSWSNFGSATVIQNCNANGFTGEFTNGLASSGTTFSVTITNNSFSVIGPINFSSSDLVLSGVSGLTVGTPTPSSASINPGASQIISYPITGTPASLGSLKGIWSKLTLSCSDTQNINDLANLLNDSSFNSKIVTNGIYLNGVAFKDNNTFSVTITNNSGSTINGFSAPSISNLNPVISGTGTVAVVSVTPSTTFNLANGSSQIIKYTLSGTPTSEGTINLNWLYCGLSSQKTINITSCGAITSTGGYLKFKCHNLGADESADPFTPNWKLNGAYIQWGKRGPTSNWQTAEHNGSLGFAAAPTGNTSATANDLTIANFSTSIAPNGSWNVTEGTPLKTENDPCPSGYRIPTKNEWTSIYSNNSNNPANNWTTVGTSWTSTSTNYTTGQLKQYSLFLPTAGMRGSEGNLFSRGFAGYYASSTPLDDTYVWVVKIDNNNGIDTTYFTNKNNAISVRCIAE